MFLRKGHQARKKISIHALREEGDAYRFGSVSAQSISIHALREEGDGILRDDPAGASQFLSTPSARRATLVIAERAASNAISIHALREEGDMQSSVIHKPE